MSSPAITFVTGNAKKLKEFQAIIGDDSIRNQSVDLEEVQGSIKDISTKKAIAAAEVIKGPVLVEDTCLVFNALSKPELELPGPYIKWFVESVGVENLPRLLAGFEDKSAQTVCTFAFTEGPGKEVKLFQGITEGKIVEPRYNGEEVFGFDPIFEPTGFSQTFGEMDKSLKNTISHRYRALEKVKEFLKTRDWISHIIHIELIWNIIHQSYNANSFEAPSGLFTFHVSIQDITRATFESISSVVLDCNSTMISGA